MKLGICYYPEHWPQERWQLDAKQMWEAGISIVRVAEFAWTLMEPRPGVYSWDWLDQTIDTFAAEGHQIVLCTPTAAPPAWIIQAHPDILPVDENGRRLKFGSRRHYCPNNPKFQEQTKTIVHALAQRYGQHPDVIGWQIDNEFACYIPRCYCENCQTAFHHWLESKYGDLDTLNQAWGTVFWSQSYNQWEQIEAPNLTVAEPNPSHVLDYYRFFSDTWVAYQQIQISGLQSKIPKTQFITHNVIGNLIDIDYHKLAKNLDFISWDSYPTGYAFHQAENFYPVDDHRPIFAHDLGDPYITGFFHDLIRGLKQAPYWVMEQQTGAINWSRYNTGVRPGALRLWTWQAMASGAEAVVYFRWRASRFGLEQHHAGLRKHDSSPDIGYNDLLSMLADRQLMEEISQEPIKNSCALLLDYNDLWAFKEQPHRDGFDYLGYLFVFYRACRQLGLGIDIVSPDVDLSKYKLVLAPTIHLASQELAQKFNAYVQQGGSLLIGIRSGFKTPTNLVSDQPLPGVFQPLVGAYVVQWHSLPPGVSYPLQSEIPNLCGEASLWAEVLKPDSNAEVLASYPTAPFSKEAAITCNPFGNGKAYYFGFYPTFDQATAFIKYLCHQHHIDILENLPAGMIAIRRANRILLFNFTDQILTTNIKGNDIQVAGRDTKIIME